MSNRCCHSEGSQRSVKVTPVPLTSAAAAPSGSCAGGEASGAVEEGRVVVADEGFGVSSARYES